MSKIWIIASFIGSFIGLAILTMAYIELHKVVKEMKEIDDKNFEADYYKSKIVKLAKFHVVGIVIASIASLLRVFLK